MQTTNHVLMVRPVRFAFNEETAGSNAFQKRGDMDAEAQERLCRQAVSEFDAFVAMLRGNGITVTVLQDTPVPFTPDSIFPNNCFSTHLDNEKRTLVLYPMLAPNRRLERTKLFPVFSVGEGSTFASQVHCETIIDLTDHEKQGEFLEGTGSLILDREHRMAYACRSPRTNETVVKEWTSQMGYDFFLFESEDKQGVPIYHTNVMMHIGTRFAIVCLKSIKNSSQREQLLHLIAMNGKEVVEISFEQMQAFAGNMLELRNDNDEKLLVMSSTARNSLTPQQVSILEKDVHIIAPDIPTIETAGGGSARCMLAEIF